MSARIQAIEAIIDVSVYNHVPMFREKYKILSVFISWYVC